MLFFFITRKISKFQFNSSSAPIVSKGLIEITVPAFILQQALKKTLLTVGIGVFLLLIILLIASKFKVILILLPISFYLIGQFFIFTNHIKTVKNQKATYNTLNNTLELNSLKHGKLSFDMRSGNVKVKEVKSVQKNNGLLMGYFELSSHQGKCHMPFLLVENLQTKPFFDSIQLLNREVETKLFPII